MSDAVEKTAAGATKGLFGILAFILLMVGIEGMTGAVQLPPGLGLPLIFFGAICAYAAFFWESAKKVLSIEAQEALGRFAQSRITWFGMVFLALQTVILSPFIEEHRWPFSYPADPAVFAERDRLQNEVGTLRLEKEPARRWRFSNELRQTQLDCEYRLEWSVRSTNAAGFWRDLFSATGWKGTSGPAELPTQAGITIRTKDRPASAQCGEAIQRELSAYFPNPPSTIVPHQQTEFLKSCQPDACVQIDVDY